MDRASFDTYIETQIVRVLKSGDVVILDNPAAHKNEKAEMAVRAKGAWILFLPPYSPDLNSIEMANSKPKSCLVKSAGNIPEIFAICLNAYREKLVLTQIKT